MCTKHKIHANRVQQTPHLLRFHMRNLLLPHCKQEVCANAKRAQEKALACSRRARARAQHNTYTTCAYCMCVYVHMFAILPPRKLCVQASISAQHKQTVWRMWCTSSEKSRQVEISCLISSFKAYVSKYVEGWVDDTDVSNCVLFESIESLLDCLRSNTIHTSTECVNDHNCTTLVELTHLHTSSLCSF